MRRFWLPLLFLLLSAPAWAQQTCFNFAGSAGSPDQWCEVYAGGGLNSGGGTQQLNGWFRPYFIRDLGFIYTAGMQDNQTTDGTFCNPVNPTLPCSGQPSGFGTLASPFSSDSVFTVTQWVNVTGHGKQPTAYTVPPFNELSSGGGVSSVATVGTGVGAAPLESQYVGALIMSGACSNNPVFNCAYDSQCGTGNTCNLAGVGAGDSVIPLCGGSTTANPPNVCTGVAGNGIVKNNKGTLFLDDEAVDFNGCDGFDSAGNPTASCAAAGTVRYRVHVDTNCAGGGNGLEKPNGNGLCRGQRQGGGFAPAYAHPTGVTGYLDTGRAWLSSPKVYTAAGAVQFGARLNTRGIQGGSWNAGSFNFVYGDNTVAGQFDHPMDRHPVGSENYDSVRGKVIKTGGFQESFSMRDMWYMCVFATAASGPSGNASIFNPCTTADLAAPKAWRHVNQSFGDPLTTCPAAAPHCMWPSNSNASYQQQDEIYLGPPFDLVMTFGGTNTASESDSYVYCLAAPSGTNPAANSYGSVIPACQVSGAYVRGAWLPACNSASCQGTQATATVNGFHVCQNAGGGTSCHGKPGGNTTPHMAYDPVDRLVLIPMGTSSGSACGVTGTICWQSVATWNPLTNDWCSSSTIQTTATTGNNAAWNGSGCSVNFAGGGPIPVQTGQLPTLSKSFLFPITAWNGTVGKLVVYSHDEPNLIYLYSPAGNVWSNVVIANAGPPTDYISLSNEAGKAMVWDDTNGIMHVLQEGNATSSSVPSIWELPDSAITGGIPLQTPGVPTGLTGTAGNAQIAFTWTAPAVDSSHGPASSYNLKCSTTSGSGYLTKASPTSSPATVGGFTNGVAEFCVISAVNAAGESANSSQISATPVAGSEGTPSPTSLLYSSQLVNTTSAGRAVTFTSSGGTTLTSIVVSVTGDFTQTNNCPASLAPAATCTVTVKFAPTATGTRTGSLSFTDSATDSPQTVNLSGTGITGLLSATSRGGVTRQQ